ncbi:MAG: hypothetical protein ACFFDC_16040, partial [Promethearchaeota archaeon]
QQKMQPKAKTIKDASVSELISFSKFTLTGVVVFVVGLGIQTIIQQIQFEGYDRWVLAVMGVAILFLFGGLVVDILNWREYTEWGALGAIIAYIGVFIIFIPFLLNLFWYGDETWFIYGIMWIIIGPITMIIGFTTRATEFDQKIIDQFIIFNEWRKAGGIHQALSALKQLIGTIIKGFFRYLWQGFKELGTRVRRFGGWIVQSTIFVLERIGIFFTKTLPKLIERSLIGLWNNLHWFGLIAVILYLLIIDIPVLNTDPLLLKAELFVIICFFFCLGVLYPQRDRIVVMAKNMSDTVLTGVISAYSMLSGAKIKTDQSVFCSRCLRGIERREFKSLVIIKGMIDPPCPFCGAKSWIGSEKVSIPKEEFIQKDKPILPSVEETPAKDLTAFEMTPSDKKAIKKGKFPTFQTYQRAKNLGVQTYSELEFIDRLGAPNLETAEKIRKGGFSHLETYQKGQTVGASSVSELYLVEEYQAPDLATTREIEKGKFPDYQSYQRAQELGVENYSDLQYIERFGAPDFETAEKVRIGGFSDFASFEKAQSFGATNVSELRLVEELDAPNFDTAKKIQEGRFPDYQTYKQGQEYKVQNYYDLRVINRLGAPDLDTAKKISDSGFPDYKTFQRAQNIGASTYSEFQFMTKKVETTSTDVEAGIQALVTEEQKESKPSFAPSTDFEIQPTSKFVQEAEVSLTPDEIISEDVFWFTEDRESLMQAIEIFESIFSDQTLKPKGKEELSLWNSKKTWLLTQKKRFLRGNISTGMFFDKMKYLEKDLLYSFRVPRERFQVIKPQQVVAEKTIPELLKELLKVSKRLSAVDTEIDEWYRWLDTQITLYLKSQMNGGVFQIMLKRTQKFLQGLDVSTLPSHEKKTLNETQALIKNILRKPTFTEEEKKKAY